LFYLLDKDENGVVSYSEMMQQIKSPAELQLILTVLEELHLCEAVDHDQPTCPTSESGRTVQVRALIFCRAISEVGPLRVQHMHGLLTCKMLLQFVIPEMVDTSLKLMAMLIDVDVSRRNSSITDCAN
jgi:hypothetical protein